MKFQKPCLPPEQRRRNLLKIYMTDQAYGDILANSQKAGLSLSEFGNRVLTGCQINSLEKQQAIREVLKVSGELGKIGGLLKQALVHCNKEQIYGLLHKIDRLQDTLEQKAENL